MSGIGINDRYNDLFIEHRLHTRGDTRIRYTPPLKKVIIYDDVEAISAYRSKLKFIPDEPPSYENAS